VIDTSQLLALGADLERSAATAEVKTKTAIRSSISTTERVAKGLVPVKTGALRDSIEASADGLTGTVTAGTDHAEYVEDGTSVMAPQPFMRPALERGAGELTAQLTHIAGTLL
jgi:HK97 gp10 family phage protein